MAIDEDQKNSASSASVSIAGFYLSENITFMKIEVKLMEQFRQSFFSILSFRLVCCCVSSIMLLSSAVATHPSTIDVDTSPLPRGPGLSDAYYGDVGIGSNSSVIFADNFEAGDYATKWDAVKAPLRIELVDESSVDPVLGNVSFKAGTNQVTGGIGSGVTKWFPSADSVFVRFDVKFDAESFGFWHLIRLRGNRADNKYSSFGTAGIKPDGTDFFSTSLEPKAGSSSAGNLGNWGTYTYWPDMPGQYGHSFPGIVPTLAEKDEWMSIEIMLKHNTPGTGGGQGLRDGEQAVWINGELIAHWGNIRWRDDETLTANAFVLETYLQDALSDPKNVAFYDNVVIASEYIGPSGLGVPEPSTLGLLMLGFASVVGCRRRGVC